MQAISIAGRNVGPGYPCFIIAEAGVNHNGDMSVAKRLVEVAKDAGADAVKFQTFKADRLVTANAPKAEYQKRSTSTEESQYEMVRKLELSLEMHQELQAHCQDQGILFMSSPFDEESANLLTTLEVAVFKIPSGEITNHPFLAHVARKGMPMIVSTGMSSMGEVEAAVHTIEMAGNRDYLLLHCVSNYPAEPADINLMAMRTMRKAFNVPVGYSDHSTGIDIPISAVALGACVIEKHFTLDRSLPGPDHLASIEPHELTAMVHSIRRVEAALGNGRKEAAASEANTAAVSRKSLVAAQDIPSGTTLTRELITVKRPGTGLPPIMEPYLLGRIVRTPIPADTLISLDMLG